MVKPGGTGSPMRDISARFAPLPPSSGFIEPFPSAFLLPNMYTYFADFGALAIQVRFQKFRLVQFRRKKLRRNACDSNKGRGGVNGSVAVNRANAHFCQKKV